jgi:hypothetical protein
MATANQKLHPWLRAAKQELTRVSPLTGGLQPVDPGVNFFILALEALGATTRFSCEGHPTGFYVAFDAPYELAVQIEAAGFFRVEIAGLNYWTIRRAEVNIESGKPYGEADKKRCLKWAVEAWLKRFPDQLKHLT